MFPLSSQVDAVREYLSRMDVEMLDLVLSDQNTYSDLNKSLFLEKLSDIFEAFKAAGDTRLELYLGECANCHKHCRGYTLLGNTSANYLDLLVAQEAGEVKDIFYCSDLINYREIDKNTGYTLSFDFEETAEYAEDPDYALLVHQCEQAMIYWDTRKETSTRFEDIDFWLNINASLYDECIGYFMHGRLDAFFDLYRKLSSLKAIYMEKDLIFKEVMLLRNVVRDGCYIERELLQWLVRNEDTGFSDAGSISCFSDYAHFSEGKVLYDEDNQVYLSENEFKPFFLYETFFTRYYDEKLNEYTVYSEQEIEAMDQESDAYRKAMSLRFNMAERQKMGLRIN